MGFDNKKIDVEMLAFFLFISLFSFSFYLFKHPLFYITSYGINRSALLEIYMPDLIIYLLGFVPYLSALIFLLFKSFSNNANMKDNYFMILFFPLFAFFSKGMFLPHIYIDFRPVTILKNNFSFVSFLLMGFVLTYIQNKLRKIHGDN